MRQFRRPSRVFLLLLFLVEVTALVAALVARPAAAAPPAGWILAGSHPNEYDTDVDKSLIYAGKPSAYLKSKSAETKGFGTLMQTVSADSYRGKRVRLVAFIKHEDVRNWAGLWMRVDGPKGAVRAFDNMGDRPIKGSGTWKRHEVVLDVAADAVSVAFGTLLEGKGEVFINGMSLSAVDQSVPVTGKGFEPGPEPKNLDFEQK